MQYQVIARPVGKVRLVDTTYCLRICVVEGLSLREIRAGKGADSEVPSAAFRCSTMVLVPVSVLRVRAAERRADVRAVSIEEALLMMMECLAARVVMVESSEKVPWMTVRSFRD